MDKLRQEEFEVYCTDATALAEMFYSLEPPGPASSVWIKHLQAFHTPGQPPPNMFRMIRQYYCEHCKTWRR